MSAITEDYDTFLITHATITSREEASEVIEHILSKFQPAFKEQSLDQFFTSSEKALQKIQSRIEVLPTRSQLEKFDELRDILTTYQLREEGIEEEDIAERVADLLMETETKGNDFDYMIGHEIMPLIWLGFDSHENIPKLILEKFEEKPPFPVIELIEEASESRSDRLPERMRPKFRARDDKKT